MFPKIWIVIQSKPFDVICNLNNTWRDLKVKCDVSLWSYVLLQWLLDFPWWTLGVKKLWIATRKLSCFGFTALTHYLFSCSSHTRSMKNVWYVYYVHGINLKLRYFCNFIEMPRRKFLWMSTWKQKSPKVPNLPSWYETFFKNNIQVECMPKPVILYIWEF